MTSPSENPPALFCPTCTYDLRYTTDPRCPECGTPFDRNDLATSRIPWVHRKQKSFGTFKAWRQTLLLALRHPTHLAREVALPVDARAASSFRWLPLLALALLFAIGLALQYPFFDPNHLRIQINFTDDIPGMALGRVFAPAFALIDGPSTLLTMPLVLFTTAAALSWWTPFCFWILGKPNSLRHRAAPLSLYLSAWLLVAALILLLNTTILTFVHDIDLGPAPLALIATLVLNIPFLLTWWLCSILLFRRTNSASFLRTTLFATLLPTGALFLFYAVSLVTLFLLGLLALIFVSLTT